MERFTTMLLCDIGIEAQEEIGISANLLVKLSLSHGVSNDSTKGVVSVTTRKSEKERGRIEVKLSKGEGVFRDRQQKSITLEFVLCNQLASLILAVSGNLSHSTLGC